MSSRYRGRFYYRSRTRYRARSRAVVAAMSVSTGVPINTLKKSAATDLTTTAQSIAIAAQQMIQASAKQQSLTAERSLQADNAAVEAQSAVHEQRQVEHRKITELRDKIEKMRIASEQGRTLTQVQNISSILQRVTPQRIADLPTTSEELDKTALRDLLNAIRSILDVLRDYLPGGAFEGLFGGVESIRTEMIDLRTRIEEVVQGESAESFDAVWKKSRETLRHAQRDLLEMQTLTDVRVLQRAQCVESIARAVDFVYALPVEVSRQHLMDDLEAARELIAKGWFEKATVAAQSVTAYVEGFRRTSANGKLDAGIAASEQTVRVLLEEFTAISAYLKEEDDGRSGELGAWLQSNLERHRQQIDRDLPAAFGMIKLELLSGIHGSLLRMKTEFLQKFMMEMSDDRKELVRQSLEEMGYDVGRWSNNEDSRLIAERKSDGAQIIVTVGDARLPENFDDQDVAAIGDGLTVTAAGFEGDACVAELEKFREKLADRGIYLPMATEALLAEKTLDVMHDLRSAGYDVKFRRADGAVVIDIAGRERGSLSIDSDGRLDEKSRSTLDGCVPTQTVTRAHSLLGTRIYAYENE